MSDIEYVVGNENVLSHMPSVKAWRPFDDRVLDFCDSLSKALVKNNRTRIFPDLLTLAFWLRKSNLNSLAGDYGDTTNVLGRGLVFHIAPGNIALSFAYSLATGLLTGNTNIIRLPSRRFEQADIFCDVLKSELLLEPEISSRICLIKYQHDKEITDWLSHMAHTRIIWGGNDTVNTIRQSPIPPRANEITFANRFSICIIDADRYLSDYEPKKTAHAFYLDTFLTDQNACSSPRIIFWQGVEIKKAKKVFWSALSEEIREYHIEPVTTSDKLVAAYKYASGNKCSFSMVGDCRIMLIDVEDINNDIVENIAGGGLFYEYSISSIKDIEPICRWELQTISYIGIDEKELLGMIIDLTPEGVDRIVPVGHTLDFSLIWDGREVVKEMTRTISLT